MNFEYEEAAQLKNLGHRKGKYSHFYVCPYSLAGFGSAEPTQEREFQEFCVLKKSWRLRTNTVKDILSREVTETICPPSNLNLDSTVTSGGQCPGSVKVFNLIQMHLNCSRTDTDDK